MLRAARPQPLGHADAAPGRRPRVHEVFGGKVEQGLCDVLDQRVDPLHLVRKTPQKNLFYLSAGSTTDDGAELLYSPMFKQMLARVHEAFPYVILDTSPVGLIGDALALSSHVDGAVVVVRRDLAPARMAQDALAQLEGAGTRVFGAVFNGVGGVDLDKGARAELEVMLDAL